MYRRRLERANGNVAACVRAVKIVGLIAATENGLSCGLAVQEEMDRVAVGGELETDGSNIAVTGISVFCGLSNSLGNGVELPGERS